MAKSSIQGFVELASGLGEMTKARATEALGEFLSLSANAPSSGKKVAKQAEKMAEEFVAAATANRQQLLEVVRGEIDKAVARLNLHTVSADVQALTGAVQGLAAQVESVAAEAVARGEAAGAAAAASFASAVPGRAKPSPSSATAASSAEIGRAHV